jgi:hypothetical protein
MSEELPHQTYPLSMPPPGGWPANNDALAAIEVLRADEWRTRERQDTVARLKTSDEDAARSAFTNGGLSTA